VKKMFRKAGITPAKKPGMMPEQILAEDLTSQQESLTAYSTLSETEGDGLQYVAGWLVTKI
jgi:hypothetical protein